MALHRVKVTSSPSDQESNDKIFEKASDENEDELQNSEGDENT